jgi:hypothetical protein
MPFLKHNKYKLLISFLLALGAIIAITYPFAGIDLNDTHTFIFSLTIFTIDFFIFFAFSVAYSYLFRRLGFFSLTKAKQQPSFAQKVFLWAGLISLILATLSSLYYFSAVLFFGPGFTSYNFSNLERASPSP